MKSSKFTLIELLTVVAVIGILASLLLPALAAARARSIAINCVSNLKQVSIAYSNKMTDSNRLLPYTDSFNAFWPVLGPYGITDNSRFCPATEKNRPVELRNQYSTNSNVGWPWVSSNGQVMGSYCFNGWAFDVDSHDWNWQADTEFFGVGLGNISQPSLTPLVIDGVWVDGWPQLGQTLPPPSQWNQADPMVDNGNLWGENRYERVTVNRHMNKEAVGYIDGHAQMVWITDIPSLKWSAAH
ncbi:MAG: hypothetical protein RL095_1386 [Verrucomicrobiota bacterium]|jgi:prepilin-type N-terminal cleavage/methylation domain-containing protein